MPALAASLAIASTTVCVTAARFAFRCANQSAHTESETPAGHGRVFSF
jgi:hypothetical protein